MGPSDEPARAASPWRNMRESATQLLAVSTYANEHLLRSVRTPGASPTKNDADDASVRLFIRSSAHLTDRELLASVTVQISESNARKTKLAVGLLTAHL
tara:strand:+ start:339 stop:635 length:297 start_codon:yes stop_codon:yes gene_type:complete